MLELRAIDALYSHLKRLEADSIHPTHKVAASFANLVMLYSIGKDSSAMVHIAMTVFFLSKPPLRSERRMARDLT